MSRKWRRRRAAMRRVMKITLDVWVIVEDQDLFPLPQLDVLRDAKFKNLMPVAVIDSKNEEADE